MSEIPIPNKDALDQASMKIQAERWNPERKLTISPEQAHEMSHKYSWFNGQRADQLSIPDDLRHTVIDLDIKVLKALTNAEKKALETNKPFTPEDKSAVYLRVAKNFAENNPDLARQIVDQNADLYLKTALIDIQDAAEMAARKAGRPHTTEADGAPSTSTPETPDTTTQAPEPPVSPIPDYQPPTPPDVSPISEEPQMPSPPEPSVTPTDTTPSAEPVQVEVDDEETQIEGEIITPTTNPDLPTPKSEQTQPPTTTEEPNSEPTPLPSTPKEPSTPELIVPEMPSPITDEEPREESSATPITPAGIPTEQEIVKRVDDELKEIDENLAQRLEESKQRRLALEQRQRERNLSGTPPPDRDASAAKNDTLPPPAPTNGEDVPVVNAPGDGELNPPPAPTQPESTNEGATEDDTSDEGVTPLEEKTQEELAQEKLLQQIERLSELMDKADEELTDEERTERDTPLTSDLPQELGFKDATELQNTLEAAQNAGIDTDTVFRFRKELPEDLTDPTSQEALDWFRQKKAGQEATEGEEEAEQKKTTERMRQEIKDAIASSDIKKLKQLTVDLGKMLYNAKYKKVPLTVKGITKFAAGSVLVFAGLYLLATLGLAKTMGGVKGGK